MKICPEITIKQFAETKYWGRNLKNHLSKTWNFSKNLISILCAQMPVYGVQILYWDFCVQNSQNVYK